MSTKINVTYIPETWVPVWMIPTEFNQVFKKVQILWWTEVENG